MLDVGSSEPLPGQVRRSSTGAASASSTVAASTAHITGRRATPFAQRSARWLVRTGALPLRTERGRIQRRSRLARAGTSTSTLNTTATTAIAVAKPKAEKVRRPGEAQAHERDEHGGAGEHDGATGGAVRPGGGVDQVGAGVEVLAEAHEEQQRVVEADAETDHRGDGGSGGADRHQAAEHGDAGEADREPADGDEDRQAGGDDRAEQQQQDQQGGDDADQLALALDGADGGARQVAAELHLEPVLAVRLDGVLERVDVLVDVGVGDRHVVLDDDERRAAVLGDPRRQHGVDVVEAGQVVAELGQGGRRERGVVVDDDLGGGVAEAREVVAQLVDADLGPGVGDVPVLLGGAAERGGEADDGAQHEHPGGQGAPGPQHGVASESLEDRVHRVVLLIAGSR